ncbi:MAG TPA: polyphosphate kinase 1 [Burkholderiales bacterium]|nr:polyphosphate kinase 1 [Burkholderiales bacterium]
MNRRIPTPAQFVNRELGILAFNRRVLAQAADDSMPLLERLRFITIVSSNLDEFFEIRIAGLKESIRLGLHDAGPDARTSVEVFDGVCREAHALVAEQYKLLNEVVLPSLAREGIVFPRREEWSAPQRQWIRDYFFRELLPVLTPIGLDPAHPFPRVLNKSLNFAVELQGKDAFGRSSRAAIVQAPRALPRLIRLPQPQAGAEYAFVFLSSILHAHVGELFAGMNVVGCYQFRVTRNSDLFVDEEEIQNLHTALQGELLHRHFGDAVRLEVADNASQAMVEFLLQQFGLRDADLYRVEGPVNLYRLREVHDQVDRPALKFAPFTPALAPGLTSPDLFDVLKKHDVLLHHPFQSFIPVIDFIRTTAEDPNVIAIKQTVYRTGTDSELMEILIEAARKGKEVTVVVELMARFDEEANLNWAARLEEVGAHVVYGVVGHKTHAKMSLIVRREEKTLKRYAHLSTGNYHPATARAYTDFGLFTANEELCADVAEVFQQLTGLGRAVRLKHVWQSPFTLHRRIVAAIRNEAKLAAEGKPARIMAKMNALLEPQVIEELYAAAGAGVKIDLIVRGVCALRPGIEGLSDNIRVRSIVGRFLEHSRVFYFENGGAEDVYLASADWMARNFFRRIELCFPVLDPTLKKRVIREGLLPYLDDNAQAWVMTPDGNYERLRARKGAKGRSAQEELLAMLTTGGGGETRPAVAPAALKPVQAPT